MSESDPTGPTSGGSQGDTAALFLGMDIWMLGLIAFMAVTVICLYAVYQARMGRLRQQEAMAQAAFEAEVLAGLPTVQPGESRIGKHYSGTNQPSSEGSPAIAVEYDQPREDRPPESAQPQTAAPDRVDAKCAWALAALRQAGILDEVESLETRFGVANASAELRLRGGKRGILIQDVEPLPSLVQLLARFDLVIVAGPVKGRAVVVKTLQQMIADRF